MCVAPPLAPPYLHNILTLGLSEFMYLQKLIVLCLPWTEQLSNVEKYVLHCYNESWLFSLLYLQNFQPIRKNSGFVRYCSQQQGQLENLRFHQKQKILNTS